MVLKGEKCYHHSRNDAPNSRTTRLEPERWGS